MTKRRADKPWRCNYCKAAAVVWVRYVGYLSRSIRPLGGGHMTLYMAACAEHEGCPSWSGMLALIKGKRENKHEVLREIKDSELRIMRDELRKADADDGDLAWDCLVALGLRRAHKGDSREQARARCANAWHARI